MNVIDSIDSFRSSVNQICDHDRCIKYVLLFVMLVLSCYFCAMSFQDNQEYCVSSDMCCAQQTFEWEFIPPSALRHGGVLKRMIRALALLMTFKKVTDYYVQSTFVTTTLWRNVRLQSRVC